LGELEGGATPAALEAVPHQHVEIDREPRLAVAVVLVIPDRTAEVKLHAPGAGGVEGIVQAIGDEAVEEECLFGAGHHDARSGTWPHVTPCRTLAIVFAVTPLISASLAIV